MNATVSIDNEQNFANLEYRNSEIKRLESLIIRLKSKPANIAFFSRGHKEWIQELEDKIALLKRGKNPEQLHVSECRFRQHVREMSPGESISNLYHSSDI